MGFHRTITIQSALDREGVAAIIRPFVAEEIAYLERMADPFAIDNACEVSPSAVHVYAGSCSDIVCVHCTKVVWQ